MGYSGDLPLEFLYRFSRHARFVDGADEVHRETVARHVLRAVEAPADGIPTNHIPTRREAARRKYAHILEAEAATRPGVAWASHRRRRGTRMLAVRLIRWQSRAVLQEIARPDARAWRDPARRRGRRPLPHRPAPDGVARGDGSVCAAVHARARGRRRRAQARARAHPASVRATACVVYSRWGCGVCWQCLQGRENVCEVPPQVSGITAPGSAGTAGSPSS